MNKNQSGRGWRFDQPGTAPTYTIDEIGKWYAIWPMAIAMAWSDPSFQRDLLENPRKTFLDRLGYAFPQSVRLTILVSPTGWTKNLEDGSFWDLPPSEVTLWLPPAPEDVQERLIALANYTATGQTYPFTCCKVVC